MDLFSNQKSYCLKISEFYKARIKYIFYDFLIISQTNIIKYNFRRNFYILNNII